MIWSCVDRSLVKYFPLGVHVIHPYSTVSMASACSMRTFRRNGAVVVSYNPGPNRLRQAHMRRIRRYRGKGRRFRGYFAQISDLGRVYNSVQLLRLRAVEVGMSSPVFVAASSPFILRYREACCFENSLDRCRNVTKSLRRHRDNPCVIDVQHASHHPSHTCQWHLFSDYTISSAR